MKRTLHFLLCSVLCASLFSEARATQFDLSTATIADLNAAFDAGALTSEKLLKLYLARIEAYDQQGPKLNTII
ncbi:MAG TPA: glutamyl-tRNA amidotransferase, partial [Opitutaceae bacterium]|nr:glutamyl-tRNA amidotransferase [Opitutaceae bacterium]